MEINVSLAAFPGLMHQDAARIALGLVAQGDLVEPVFGPVQAKHVQVVPQSFGRFDLEMAENFKQAWPETKFRLHANVRTVGAHRVADLGNAKQHMDYFEVTAKVHRALGGEVYSAHSGSRADATMDEMFDNARRLSDLFGCPVAIEGQYPTRHRSRVSPKDSAQPGDEQYLVCDWAEYAQLLQSGLPFALDLSHLNIVATQTKKRETGLVREMLASEACLEVHVSANDGRGDAHQVCDERDWWFELMDSIHPNAVIFTEGNHRRRIKEALNG